MWLKSHSVNRECKRNRLLFVIGYRCIRLSSRMKLRLIESRTNASSRTHVTYQLSRLDLKSTAGNLGPCSSFKQYKHEFL